MTYTWKCSDCGDVRRVSRPMKDCLAPPGRSGYKENPNCEYCGGWEYERVFEAPAIVTGDGVKI